MGTSSSLASLAPEYMHIKLLHDRSAAVQHVGKSGLLKARMGHMDMASKLFTFTFTFT